MTATNPTKIDLYKENKHEYAATRKPRLVEPAGARYITVNGHGEPGSQAFEAAIGALYGVAYTIKMGRKKAGVGPDFTVSKLEAQYWGRRKTGDFSKLPKSEWNWKMMIRMPAMIGEDDVADAIEALLAKGKDPAAKKVRLEEIDEGECVQQLHVGPYDTVGETIEAMREYCEEEGRRFDGIYHEMYLSDPRRAAPEKLKTIVRIPVA